MTKRIAEQLKQLKTQIQLKTRIGITPSNEIILKKDIDEDKALQLILTILTYRTINKNNTETRIEQISFPSALSISPSPELSLFIYKHKLELILARKPPLKNQLEKTINLIRTAKYDPDVQKITHNIKKIAGWIEKTEATLSLIMGEDYENPRPEAYFGGEEIDIIIKRAPLTLKTLYSTLRTIDSLAIIKLNHKIEPSFTLGVVEDYVKIIDPNSNEIIIACIRPAPGVHPHTIRINLRIKTGAPDLKGSIKALVEAIRDHAADNEYKNLAVEILEDLANSLE